MFVLHANWYCPVGDQCVCVCSVIDHAWLHQYLLFCVCSGPGCGTVALVQSPAAVQSPDYPRSYGDDTYCRWVIYVPEGYVAKVTRPEGHGQDVRLARSARLWTWMHSVAVWICSESGDLAISFPGQRERDTCFHECRAEGYTFLGRHIPIHVMVYKFLKSRRNSKVVITNRHEY